MLALASADNALQLHQLGDRDGAARALVTCAHACKQYEIAGYGHVARLPAMLHDYDA